jgi:haloacetate dehalogenase
MGAEAYADYRRAIHDPETVHAMCEDYRAGLGIDCVHDEDDRRAGHRLACPLLVLWAGKDDLEAIYGDVREVWRGWSDDVRGRALACGHHMAEEAPEELAQEILTFLAMPRVGRSR